MKRIMVGLAVVAATLVAAAPAGALSCVPPDPIDWKQRFPQLDAAFVIEVESVKEAADERIAGSLTIAGLVVEVFKGNPGRAIEYAVPSLNPWGPYYQPGDRVAVIVENDVVSDGRQNICGPWYEPAELRRAAELYGDLEPIDPPKPDPPAPEPIDEPSPKPPPDEPPIVEPLPPERSTSVLSFLYEILRLILQVLGLR